MYLTKSSLQYKKLKLLHNWWRPSYASACIQQKNREPGASEKIIIF